MCTKLCLYFAALVCAIAATNAQKWSGFGHVCWSCTRATSQENCLQVGKRIKCRFGDVCHIEWRFENGLYILNKGCKEENACSALEKQNPPQCHPEIHPKVCRHCCYKNECNKRIRLPFTVTESSGQCTNEKAMQPTPENLQPLEECVINIPRSCVDAGTVVFTTDKLAENERQEGMEFRNKTLKEGKCIRNPIVETMAVYDNGDSVTFLTRIDYRFANGLPYGTKFVHLVGEKDVMDFVNEYTEK